MHPIIHDLASRFTAKQYDKNKRISEQDLQVIFESLRLSASSINSQPWRFVVIESDEARARLAKTFEQNFQMNQKHAYEASQILLLAHKPYYQKEDFERVVQQNIADGRAKPEDMASEMKKFHFAELNTDETGFNGAWTKSQLYIALGNVLHTLARLGIDSTPMEGMDAEQINEAFADELGEYRCEVLLAMGYSKAGEDYNASLPKSRLPMHSVLTRI